MSQPSRLAGPPSLESLPDSQRARRDRIIEAALGLLRTRDHAQVQMKDVAGEAGVALGTLYRYFRSKDHLMAEVLAHWARGLRTSVERRPLSGSTNAERLTDALQRSLRGLQAWPHLARLVLALEASEDPFTREIFARNSADNLEVYLDALSGLPPHVATDVVRVATSVLDVQLRQWVAGQHSIAEVYDRIGRAVWLVLEFSEHLAEQAPAPARGR